jgi:hypothetical protein
MVLSGFIILAAINTNKTNPALSLNQALIVPKALK